VSRLRVGVSGPVRAGGANDVLCCGGRRGVPVDFWHIIMCCVL